MNTIENETEVILNQHGEPTELTAPADFGNGLSFLNPTDMPDLDAAEVGFNIQPESVEFKTEGETLRAVFNGFTTFNVKDQVNEGQYVPRKTAVLQTKSGIKINMGANLLKQLDLIPVGTAIQITYRGEQKTNGGRKVKVYEVHTLNVPRMNVGTLPQLKAATPAPSQPDEPKPMTYDDAWQVTIKVQGVEKQMGELSKEQLDYVVEKSLISRNAEAARIVLEHDFQMSPIVDEDGQEAFPF